MRAPEELHLVDWAELGHAFGSATEVPDWVRALYGGDAAAADRAVDGLFGRALHQGTASSAGVAAVPYLAHAAVHGAHHRDRALEFIAGTGGTEEHYWYEEEDRPGEELAGRARASAELPFLLPLLGDADAEVRRQVVRVARWAAGESLPLAVAALADCLQEDPSPAVRAEALEVLSRLNGEQAGTLRAALADGAPAVRATAALGLLEAAEPPYCERLLDVLLADGGDPAFRMARDEWFPGVGSTESRVQRLLDADPDATRAAAAAWTAAGDHHARGTRRALRLAARWPGREAEALDLMAAALPHQPDRYWRQNLLWGLAEGAVRHPDPGRLAGAALPYAADPDHRIAEPAQLVLGRTGDARLLGAVPDPAPAALDALAARTDDPALRRRALAPYRSPYDGAVRGAADELLDVLTPADTAALLPELVRLLRAAPSRKLLHLLGGSGRADRQLVDAVGELAANDGHDLQAAAAVAAVRLGADPGPALRLLAERLDQGWGALTEAALLGPVGAPLLPLVERHLTASAPQGRVDAAEALWRITGDARRSVPVLLEVFRPTWPGLRALTVLRLIGRPLPAEHLALLDSWLSPGHLGPSEEEVFWHDRLGNRLRAQARLLRAQQP
ncbi:HEAT repeat domain-containing protein [Kitasatospora sp. NPDC057198]|uniref:HEAT repeat domain-containing protein n=1 Tax=Kitasatospora sp. NPDC057198 TaxID=3346046 RepID=UPI00362A5496